MYSASICVVKKAFRCIVATLSHPFHSMVSISNCTVSYSPERCISVNTFCMSVERVSCHFSYCTLWLLLLGVLEWPQGIENVSTTSTTRTICAVRSSAINGFPLSPIRVRLTYESVSVCVFAWRVRVDILASLCIWQRELLGMLRGAWFGYKYGEQSIRA